MTRNFEISGVGSVSEERYFGTLCKGSALFNPYFVCATAAAKDYPSRKNSIKNLMSEKTFQLRKTKLEV